MTDEEWAAYHREFAEYQHRIDRIERTGRSFSHIVRPWPPSPPPARARQSTRSLQFAKPRGSGAMIRDADELMRRFCEWRRATIEPQTQSNFADSIGVSSRTIRDYCHDYRLPWRDPLQVKCP